MRADRHSIIGNMQADLDADPFRVYALIIEVRATVERLNRSTDNGEPSSLHSWTQFLLELLEYEQALRSLVAAHANDAGASPYIPDTPDDPKGR